MTIIESLRSLIKDCPHLQEFNKGINNENIGNNSSLYEIEEMPTEPILKKYVNGDSINQYEFMFMTKETYEKDVIKNLIESEFDKHFISWIKEMVNNKKLPQIEGNRQIQSIEASLTAGASEEDNLKEQYQIKFILTYYQGGR
ncbi:chloramphenicol resistance protein [Clostridium sp. SHJSY1]|uniref:chloramphenicol resistance protein n=1 Tax=Clostridium sp. SHJSY1 TaxID=2942483 RepID=UPI0028759A5E|nr:chloramphenicol resistance protein [Clostridium sp. SHJSY1]MDS0525008.1 chloramphenicol resistance protein [Clostridium sp. SHJSY1]